MPKKIMYQRVYRIREEIYNTETDYYPEFTKIRLDDDRVEQYEKNAWYICPDDMGVLHSYTSYAAALYVIKRVLGIAERMPNVKHITTKIHYDIVDNNYCEVSDNPLLCDKPKQYPFTMREDNITFISQYETVSKNQMYMHNESLPYLQAENWLKENEEKYIAIINLNNPNYKPKE